MRKFVQSLAPPILATTSTFLLLSACAPDEGGDAPIEEGVDLLLSDNGLSPNGLSPNGMSLNGLSGNGLSGNGLSSNGLSGNGLSANGLSASAFKSWFHSGSNNSTSQAYAAQIMKYTIRCACPSNVTRTFYDSATGTTYTWQGNLGLASGWCDGSAATTADQEWVSACLLAHVNTLATQSGAPLSMQLSIETNSSTLQIAKSGEEEGALTYREGVFFGNIFNQQLGGKKGAYVARGAPDDSVDFKAQFGRTVPFKGTADIELVGWKYDVAGNPPSPDYYFNPDHGYSLYSCSSDSNCVGKNGGLTPSCSPDAPKYCIPKVNACTASGGLPRICTDTSGRSWDRLLQVRIARDLYFSTLVQYGYGASKIGCSSCNDGVTLTGLDNGGYAELPDARIHEGPTSTYYRISLRFRNSGPIKIETRPETSTTRTSCGTKTLSCASGQNCWVHYDGCKLTNSTKNYIRVTGTGSTGPDVDVVMIGALR